MSSVCIPSDPCPVAVNANISPDPIEGDELDDETEERAEERVLSYCLLRELLLGRYGG